VLRAEVLLVAPKIVQALIAATGDYYTWKLAQTTYGTGSVAAAAALVVTVGSPWQWFCSTRTFSNCLEMTLTVVALYNWPWHWSVNHEGESHFQIDSQGLRVRDADNPTKGVTNETTRLRKSLLLAAVATILRPTNILIWLALTFTTFLRREKKQWLVKVPFTEQTALVDAATWTLIPSQPELTAFVREATLCGISVLGLSAVVDRFFYDAWTFPPLNFLYFNVVQSLAIFYGNNNWHYYMSQGYPLLLLSALPFTIAGMYHAFSRSHDFMKLPLTSRNTLLNLATVSLFVPGVLSIISHKEVRFIYPLLPGLHVLAALPITTYFTPAFEEAIPSSRNAQLYKRIFLGMLLGLNLIVALYTSTVHNSGLVNVTHYLRHQFEAHYLPQALEPQPTNNHNHSNPVKNMTVGFLMPCHSTPWRSHLQYPPSSSSPGIDAWALTCEPPLNLNPAEKAVYLDEADQFYADPEIWLKRHMSRTPPSIPNGKSKNHASPAHRPRRMFEIESGSEESLWRERQGRRPWPEYLVFFEQLEPVMRRVGLGSLTGGYYQECSRVWNSVVHEDWRRAGDVIVWCLYEDRALERKDVVAEGVRREVEMAKQKVGEAKVKAQERVERIVEKPFWKTAPLVQSRKAQESWWQWTLSKVGLGKEKKKSWWEGGNWS
jgi:GPI mannosyltransferase 3